MKPAAMFSAVITASTVAFTASAAPAASSPHIIYVRADAPPPGDGTAWASAFVDLQDALEAAKELEKPVEIWIAAGTYKPDRGTGDRTMSFEMQNGVGLFGGFAGWETMLDQRDWQVNESILSGDLNGDDDPEWEESDASGCCSTQSPIGCDDAECAALVLAMYPECNAPNNEWSKGCALAAYEHCCTMCRQAHCENALHVIHGAQVEGVTLDGMTVTGGEANLVINSLHGSRGGGIYLEDSSVSIRNCLLKGNGAGRGGALFVHDFDPNTEVLFEDNLVHLNYSPDYGGGAVANETVGVTVRNSVFDKNSGGGLVYNEYGNNSAILNCVFSGTTRGRSLSLDSGNPVVRDCIFVGNSPTIGGVGGALEVDSPGTVTVANCRFHANALSGMGSAIRASGGLILFNSILSGNAGSSGTVTCNSCVILNSIFYSNLASSSSSSATISSLDPALIYNSIFVENYNGSGLSNWGGPTMTGDYNCVQGQADLMPGVGNIDVDPMFVDPIGPDGIPATGDEDFRLSPESPLINYGLADPPLAPPFDLDGHARILCGGIDTGPYEFGIGDYDCDKAVELTDFAAWNTCMTGPDATRYADPACAAFDFSAAITDETIDLVDFAGFQRAWQGDRE